jgi:hypothetical protein
MRQPPKDLLNHVQNEISEAEIRLDGLDARLALLHEVGKISPSEILGKSTWKICGESTIANKVWKIVSSLVKLECNIEEITHTIRKQNPEITSFQITDSIGILQTKKILHVKENKTVTITDVEKSFLQGRMNS